MDKFSSKHLGFVLLGIVIVSFKTYPTLFTRNGGRDTWIAMAAASLLALCYLLFMLRVVRISNYKSLYNIYCSAIGNKLGYLLLFFYAATISLTLVESASVEANAMHTNIILEVPNWQYLMFFILPALYTVKKGKAAIMSVTIIAMVLVSLSGTNLALLTLPYKHLDYIRPILQNGISMNLVMAMLQILGLYGSLSIIFLFITDIEDKTSIRKHLLIAMLFVIQMEFVSMIGIIMTFQINFLNTMPYPKLLQTQLISEFRFMESGELFVMLQIIGGWHIKFILCFYGLLKLCEGMKIKIKYLPYWVSLFCFIVSYYFSNNLFRLFKFLNYYTYICLVNYVLIPFFIFIIYLIRNRKHSQNRI